MKKESTLMGENSHCTQLSPLMFVVTRWAPTSAENETFHRSHAIYFCFQRNFFTTFCHFMPRPPQPLLTPSVIPCPHHCFQQIFLILLFLCRSHYNQQGWRCGRASDLVSLSVARFCKHRVSDLHARMCFVECLMTLLGWKGVSMFTLSPTVPKTEGAIFCRQ